MSFVSPRSGSIEGRGGIEGKQNSLFPVGPVINCLFIPPNSKIQQIMYKLYTNYFLEAGRHTNLPRFQVARPDHVRVESSSCCFPRELVSFDPWHVTRSPPIGKRI